MLDCDPENKLKPTDLLTHHELSGATERISIKTGTQRPL